MRILLAEDDLPLAEADYLLTTAGYAVDYVHDGLSAMDLALTETFDLVILDLNLPGLDGLGVLRAIRARRNQAAVTDLMRAAHPGPGRRGLTLVRMTM